MDSSGAFLTKAYQSLQLNPNNLQRLEAFKSLCWKRILHHASPQWVQHAQSGTVCPTWRSRVTNGSSGGRLHVREYDDTLESLAFEFTRVYAELIWPSTGNSRSHLAPSDVEELRALSAQTRARTRVTERLERLRGVPATERMVVVESGIGRRVREFLKELVLSTAVPLHESRSAEELILKFLGRETVAVGFAQQCSYRGCGASYVSREALLVHEHLGHRVVARAPTIIDLTNDDDDVLFESSSVNLQAASKPEALATHQERDHPMTTQAALPVNQTPQAGMNDSATLPWSVWFPAQQAKEQTGSVSTPHPKITSARYPCLHAGCGRVYVWSEALVTHQDLAHPAIDHVAPQTYHQGLAHPIIPQVVQQTDGQQDLAHPVIDHVAPQTYHQDLAHPVVPQAAPQTDTTTENSTSGVNLAPVIDLVGSGDEEEEEIRGLLCPHDGCPLRFLEWALYDAHAQLPHDGDAYASKSGDRHTPKGSNTYSSSGGDIHTSNSVDGVSSLLQAVETPVIEESHMETSSSGVQSAPTLVESQSGDVVRWRSMSGARA